KKQRAEQEAIQPTTPSTPMVIPQQVETPHHLRTVYPSSLHRLPTVHETPRQRKLASARRRQRTAEKRLSLRENRLNVAKSGVDMIVKSQRESENVSGLVKKSQQQIDKNQQQIDTILRQKEADRCDLNAAIGTFQEESLQLEDDLDEKDEIDDEVEQLEAAIEEDRLALPNAMRTLQFDDPLSLPQSPVNLEDYQDAVETYPNTGALVNTNAGPNYTGNVETYSNTGALANTNYDDGPNTGRLTNTNVGPNGAFVETYNDDSYTGTLASMNYRDDHNTGPLANTNAGPNAGAARPNGAAGAAPSPGGDDSDDESSDDGDTNAGSNGAADPARSPGGDDSDVESSDDGDGFQGGDDSEDSGFSRPWEAVPELVDGNANDATDSSLGEQQQVAKFHKAQNRAHEQYLQLRKQKGVMQLVLLKEFQGMSKYPETQNGCVVVSTLAVQNSLENGLQYLESNMDGILQISNDYLPRKRKQLRNYGPNPGEFFEEFCFVPLVGITEELLPQSQFISYEVGNVTETPDLRRLVACLDTEGYTATGIIVLFCNHATSIHRHKNQGYRFLDTLAANGNEGSSLRKFETAEALEGGINLDHVDGHSDRRTFEYMAYGKALENLIGEAVENEKDHDCGVETIEKNHSECVDHSVETVEIAKNRSECVDNGVETLDWPDRAEFRTSCESTQALSYFCCGATHEKDGGCIPTSLSATKKCLEEGTDDIKSNMEAIVAEGSRYHARLCGWFSRDVTLVGTVERFEKDFPELRSRRVSMSNTNSLDPKFLQNMIDALNKNPDAATSVVFVSGNRGYSLHRGSSSNNSCGVFFFLDTSDCNGDAQESLLVRCKTVEALEAFLLDHFRKSKGSVSAFVVYCNNDDVSFPRNNETMLPDGPDDTMNVMNQGGASSGLVGALRAPARLAGHVVGLFSPKQRKTRSSGSQKRVRLLSPSGADAQSLASSTDMVKDHSNESPVDGDSEEALSSNKEFDVVDDSIADTVAPLSRDFVESDDEESEEKKSRTKVFAGISLFSVKTENKENGDEQHGGHSPSTVKANKTIWNTIISAKKTRQKGGNFADTPPPAPPYWHGRGFSRLSLSRYSMNRFSPSRRKSKSSPKLSTKPSPVPVNVEPKHFSFELAGFDGNEGTNYSFGGCEQTEFNFGVDAPPQLAEGPSMSESLTQAEQPVTDDDASESEPLAKGCFGKMKKLVSPRAGQSPRATVRRSTRKKQQKAVKAPTVAPRRSTRLAQSSHTEEQNSSTRSSRRIAEVQNVVAEETESTDQKKKKRKAQKPKRG
ncbi:MAG: hypothetical protein SGILL_005673, partial [Bacillariaceae sp.]